MPLPPLETARLALRPVVLDDVGPLHELWTDPDVRRYLWDDQVIDRDRAERTVRDAIAAAADGLGLWVLVERATRVEVGFCGLIRREPGAPPELIYGLTPGAWKRGLATEASRAALGYAFDTLGCDLVLAATDPPNLASIRVLERVGMRFTRRGLLNGLDTLFYEIDAATARADRARR